MDAVAAVRGEAHGLSSVELGECEHPWHLLVLVDPDLEVGVVFQMRAGEALRCGPALRRLG